MRSGWARGHAEADGAAVVLACVEGVAGEVHRLGEVIHYCGDVVEGVGEIFWRRGVAVAEAGVVGGDQMELVGEASEQRLEHARGGGKAMQQEKGGGVFGAGFAVEDREVVDFDCVVGDGVGHGGLR